MKISKKRMYEYLIYTMCVLMFSLAFYTFVVNYQHYHAINEKTLVSDLDNDYTLFKENVVTIEKMLTKYSYKNTKLRTGISKCVNIMKQNGVYTLMPGDKLNYKDLYVLNDFFIENIYNEGWISSVRAVFNDSAFDEMMNMLINNANYIKKDFLNNSNYFYNYDNKLRNNINDKYHYILKNYKEFSFIILSVSSRLGDNNG